MIASSYSRMLLAGAACAGILAWPLSACAEIVPPEAEAPPSAIKAWFGNAALDPETLGRYRGGTEIEIDNENTLHGTVDNNYAHDLVTGSNLVGEGSFAGASGLSTVIQNSGNNVLIQNSTIINLQFQ